MNDKQYSFAYSRSVLNVVKVMNTEAVMEFKKNVNFILILLLSSLSILRYLDFIKVNFNLLVNIVFIIIIGFNIREILTTLYKYKMIVFFLCLVLEFYFILTLLYRDVSFDDFYTVLLAFSMFFIFRSIEVSEKSREYIIFHIIILNLICSYAIIFHFYNSIFEALYNVGTYFYGRKNSVGPILCMSSIYFVYRFFYIKKNYLYILGSLLMILALTILQSRTNIFIALIISAIIGFYRQDTIKKKIYTGIILATVILLAVTIFNDNLSFIIEKMFRTNVVVSNNYSTLDNLSTGRASAFKYGFQNFLESPLLGAHYSIEIIAGDSISFTGVHSIWFRVLFYGGVIYFGIFLGLVISLWMSIKNYVRQGTDVFFLILAGLILSMVDPLAPFGAGTAYLLFWFILATRCRETNVVKV